MSEFVITMKETWVREIKIRAPSQEEALEILKQSVHDDIVEDNLVQLLESGIDQTVEKL